MMVIRRKNLVVGILVVLLIITGYLNYKYNQNAPLYGNQIAGNNDKQTDKQSSIKVEDVKDGEDKDKGDKTQNGDNKNKLQDTVPASSSAFFTSYRFEREDTRKKEIEYINSVIDNPKIDNDMKKEAQAQLLEITKNMEKELAIESLIKSKGFDDAIAILHKDLVNVVVGKEELSPEEVAQILDIVKRESGEKAENIKIIPKSEQ